MYSASSEISVFNVLKVVKRCSRQILILGLAISTALVALNEEILPERYEASTVVKINFNQWIEMVHRQMSIVNMPQIRAPLEFSQTELLSRTNIKNSIRNIIKQEKYKSNAVDKMLSSFGIFKKGASQEAEITALQSLILIQSESPGSNIITMKLRGKDPVYAASVLDQLIKSYVDSRKTSLIKISDETIAATEDQLKIIKTKLKTYEDNLLKFTKTEDGKDSSLTSFDLSKQTLRDTVATIKELEYREASLQATLNKEPEMLTDRSSASTLSSDDLILQKTAQLSDLKSRYTDTHPDIRVLENEIASLKKAGNSMKISIPNPERNRLRADLITIRSSLEKARYQKDDLESVLNKGLPVSANSIIRGLSLLIEALNTEKVALETQLTKEQIRKDSIEANTITLIETIDPAHSRSLLLQNRYILMIAGLFLGLLIAVITYWIKSYLILNRIQYLYGPIANLPSKLSIKLIKEQVDKKTGKKKLTYSMTEDADKALMVLHNEEADSTFQNNDAVKIELLAATKSRIPAWISYPTIIIGYGWLLSVIADRYLNDFYLKLF
jgi:hypothetical protein